MAASRLAVLGVVVSCSPAKHLAGGSASPSTASSARDTSVDWDAPGDSDRETGSVDDSGLITPRWLSWSGTDTLTVDVLADGRPECIFRWQATGLQVVEPCVDCDFDFDVVADVVAEESTCTGAVQVFERRWWRDGMLYRDDTPLEDAVIDGDSLTARVYSLEIDETYGTPVATTLELVATLR
ncbi:MAG: hypothetical protein CL927_11480 [Deltaproteobacteria bacterium]|nr:hypothetical protein [Deltaproteobacteria bacterium]HCH65576.1 hypothetical protein [Deltaproteobacteria bacterium]